MGRVLGRTFSLWARNGRAFSTVALLVEAPAIALAFALARPGQTSDLERLQSTLANLLGLVTSGALTYGVLQALRGERPRARTLLGAGLRKFFRIFWVSVSYQFLVGIGLLLIVVPGVVAAAGLFVAVPVAMAEPRLVGTTQTLWRSWALTKGRRLGVLVVALVALGFLLALIAIAEAIAATVPAPWYVAPALEQAAFVLGSGLLFTAPAVAYHDLRVEKEGVSADELVKVFE